MIGATQTSILRKIACISSVLAFLLGCTTTQNNSLKYKDEGKFLSGSNQRGVQPLLSVSARLATTSRGQLGQPLRVSWVNGTGSQRGRPGTAFYFSDDEAQVLLKDTALNSANKIEIVTAGGVSGKQISDVVRLNFQGETLDYFVKQVLGGILQVNYVIDEPLKGSVEFKTETPLAKDQMLSLVRVMLGRNGYILKLIDNIFHIGRPETIESIERHTGFGSSGDLKLRILPIRSAKPEDAAKVLQAILPAGASAVPVEGTNKIALRARPEDIAAVEDLADSLYNRNNDRTIVSILRLQQSSAVQVSKQIMTLFQQLYPNQVNPPLTIIPLEAQQSLLVAVQNRQMLARVRRIAKEVDYSLLDAPKLRIVPLKYLPAKAIAAQLTEILGANTSPASLPVAEENQIKPTNSKNASGKPRQRVVSATGVEPSKTAGGGLSRVAVANQLLGESDNIARAAPVRGKISIVADHRNNALLVNSTYQEFKHIRDVVNTLDLPLSQVVIEATIAEVSINDNLSYGVQWFLSRGNFSGGVGRVAEGATRPTGTGGVLSLNTVGVDVVLKALQEVTKVKVISSPYLTVLDGKKARLVIGDQVPFASRSQESSNDGTVTTSTEVEVKDTGIVLQVEPKVRSNNSVLLAIQQEVSNVDVKRQTGNLTPTISTRTINSDIVVESGRTILLGGLIQERTEDGKTGVPVLNKIPVLGELFNENTSDEKKRTELLVMITPRVVRRQSELQSITDTLRREFSGF